MLQILRDKQLLQKDIDESELNETVEGITSLLIRQGYPERDVQTKPITILLSDICGFSAIANSYPATDVVDLLNRYFSRMGDHHRRLRWQDRQADGRFHLGCVLAAGAT